ncbi:MAG TPA: 50S ribosomal protein L15 [Candidatus Limnocylindria bacterium]|nr:50S ribosomal protein L15 [Candidatus Limnocylindria bacterium]
MKLHDLKPAPGSRKAKRRVGRGIAAGQGKTAGRGTKGQKARAGGKIPAWFEGGQTPLHQRIPKLRGFKNLFKIQYEVVNLGDIAGLVELGEIEGGDMAGTKPSKKGAAPITVNQEILRAAGLVRRLDRPMKVLGGGAEELSTALFVVADAFSASARAKIEAAGGTVSVLEVPDAKRPALGVVAEPEAAEAAAAGTEADADEAGTAATAADAGDTTATDDAAPAAATPKPKAPKAGKATKAANATKAAKAAATDAESSDDAATEAPAAKPRAARKPKAPKTDPDA